MLLATVLLWALNVSVTKYILDHGLAPLAYATVRYALAAVIFVGLALLAERSLRIERRHLPTLALAAVVLWLNQLSFVLALDATTATTISPQRSSGRPTTDDSAMSVHSASTFSISAG